VKTIGFERAGQCIPNICSSMHPDKRGNHKTVRILDLRADTGPGLLVIKSCNCETKDEVTASN
jgi:hypothetical protein